ncbi:type II toxin-antitoxin system MqsR family toxin [Corallococcus sp. AB050B]|nr:type II toxin-antitoxin system MqsR family toxin [Corallococcus sp. AB050B]
MHSKPTYDLPLFQKQFPTNGLITKTARRSATELGLSPDDIDDIVSNLTSADFYKSMPSKMIAGLWQDVYRTDFLGTPLYVKIQMQDSNTCAVLISLKEK